MEIHDQPSVYDRDQDRPYRPPTLVREEVGLYQRIVVNPCLAILAWLLVLSLLGLPFWRLRVYPVFIGFLFFISPLLVLFLLQFHCLDCGATGWVRRLPEHACAGVAERKRTRQVRVGGLGSEVQVRIWFGLVYLAVVVYLILTHHGG